MSSNKEIEMKLKINFQNHPIDDSLLNCDRSCIEILLLIFVMFCSEIFFENYYFLWKIQGI